MLLIAKFVPGLSTVSPPLVGALGLRPSAFLLFDGIGSLLWASVAVGLGYIFAAQVDDVLTVLASAGTLALELLLGLLALYVLARWWQRQRLLRTLRMARISVVELRQAMLDHVTMTVVDVRPQASRQLDARTLPGALLIEPGRGVDLPLRDIPFDRELVLYCNCPNEVSAAKVARVLMARGYRRVRPLQGGIDAWDAAGFPVLRLAPDDVVARLA